MWKEKKREAKIDERSRKEMDNYEIKGDAITFAFAICPKVGYNYGIISQWVFGCI